MATFAGEPRFPTPTHRAIVVGGGISGLTAAFRHRQRAFDVTVLEATNIVAGESRPGVRLLEQRVGQGSSRHDRRGDRE
jgi:monoamine oxidase